MLPVPVFVHQLGQRSRSRRYLDEDGQPPQQEQPQPDTSSVKGQEILPLFPGYGTHYAYVYVGTPPQRQSVIIDTGTYTSNSIGTYTYTTSKYACVCHYHHKHKYLSIYKSIHICIYLCNHLSIFTVFLSSYLSPARYFRQPLHGLPVHGLLTVRAAHGLLLGPEELLLGHRAHLHKQPTLRHFAVLYRGVFLERSA